MIRRSGLKCQTFFVAILCAVLSCAFSVSAYGQAVSGSIVGTISDASGAVIPQATVTITDEGTGHHHHYHGRCERLLLVCFRQTSHLQGVRLKRGILHRRAK